MEGVLLGGRGANEPVSKVKDKGCEMACRKKTRARKELGIKCCWGDWCWNLLARGCKGI